MIFFKESNKRIEIIVRTCSRNNNDDNNNNGNSNDNNNNNNDNNNDNNVLEFMYLPCILKLNRKNQELNRSHGFLCEIVLLLVPKRFGNSKICP